MSGQFEWKAISLTTVIYPKGDWYGKFLALCSLLPVGIVIAFFTLTIFVRDIHVILFFIGQLLNETINCLLKNIVREDRPVQVFRDQLLGQSYGWPSSHSQFMAFFIVYSTLCIMFRLRKTKPFWLCLVLISLQFFATIFVLHSRIYLLYHHAHQCFHGVCIGALFAVFWYFLVQVALEPLLHKYLMFSRLNRIIGLCSIYLPLTPISRKKQK